MTLVFRHLPFAALAWAVMLISAACTPTAAPPGTFVLPTLDALSTATPPTPSATLAASATVIDAPAQAAAQVPSATPGAPGAVAATTTAASTPAPSSVTFTPSPTITDTPTRTATATFTPSATPTATLPPPQFQALGGLLDALERAPTLPPIQYPAGGGVGAPAAPGQPVPGGVPVSGGQAPPGNCLTPADGAFVGALAASPTVAATLGCPAGNARAASSAIQSYQGGVMVWVDGFPRQIFVLHATGQLEVYTDTWADGSEPTTGEQPPPGLVTPARGFGLVWRTYPPVRTGLGWATAGETGGSATLQAFAGGLLLRAPDGVTYALVGGTRWQRL